MVENHVLSIGYTSAVLTVRTVVAHTETHIAYNYVVCSRETHTVAIYGDTLTGSCLTSYVKVAAEYKTRVDAYYTSHVEHDDTVWLAYSVA